MPRATGPESQLGTIEGLHKPAFHVGDIVVPGRGWQMNKAYYRKEYARKLIKDTRRHLTAALESIGRKAPARLPEGNKAKIRDCVGRLFSADEYEVGGVNMEHAFNIDSTSFNECYLSGVPGAASPPDYSYQLVVRFVDEKGNRCALVTSMGIGESSLAKKGEQS